MKAAGLNLHLRSKMKDERKTKHQLISELNALRRQLDSPPSTVAMFDRTPAGPEPSDDKFEILFNQFKSIIIRSIPFGILILVKCNELSLVTQFL